MGIWSATSDSISKIVGSVATVATTTSSVIDQAAASVDLLGALITKAKAEQAKHHIIAAKDFEDELIDSAAEAKAQRFHALEKRLSGNARLQELFTENQREYKELFAPKAA